MIENLRSHLHFVGEGWLADSVGQSIFQIAVRLPNSPATAVIVTATINFARESVPTG